MGPKLQPASQLVNLDDTYPDLGWTVEELTEKLDFGDMDDRSEVANSKNAPLELYMRAAKDEDYWVLYTLLNNPAAPMEAVLEAGRRIRTNSRGFTFFLFRVKEYPEYADYPVEWLVEAFD